MFAYVRFLEDNEKDIVPVSAIKNFDAATFDSKVDLNKKFKIKWKNNYYYGTVIYTADTEEQLHDKIDKTRTKIPPATLAVSATEDTDTEERIHKNNNKKKKMEDMLNRKLGNLLEKDNINTKENNINRITVQTHGEQRTQKKLTDLRDENTPRSSKRLPLLNTPEQLPKLDKEAVIKENILLNHKSKNLLGKANHNTKEDYINGIPVQNHGEQETQKHLTASQGQDTPTSSKRLDLNTSETRSKLDKEALAKENMFLKKQNMQLRSKIEENEKMIGELTTLNMDLQRNVISQFDELKSTMTPLFVNNQDLHYVDVLPLVGYKRQSTNCIHLGLDIWLPVQVYESIVLQSRSSAQFVKNVAVAIFGIKTLKESSMTGRASNRNKNIPARPKLDSKKMLAIKSILRHWLTVTKKLDEASVDYEAELVSTHVTKKIAEYNKKFKVKLFEESYEEAENKENEDNFCDQDMDVDEANLDEDDRNNQDEVESNNTSYDEN